MNPEMKAEARGAPPKSERMEIVISGVLRVGIVISLTLVVGGVAVMFVHHPEMMHSPAALEHLHSDTAKPLSLTEVFAGAAGGRGRSIIMLGALALLLTPILRVATSIMAFAAERDFAFVVITSVVLVFLLLSLLLGKHV